MTRDQIFVIGGGTFFHVRPHLALAAPAFGNTVYDITHAIIERAEFDGEVHLYTTKMAGDSFEALQSFECDHGSYSHKETRPVEFPEDDPRHSDEYCPGLETNDDVLKLVMDIVNNPRAKILFLPAALCDFQGFVLGPPELSEEDGVKVTRRERTPSGKSQPRLKSSEEQLLRLEPAPKVIRRIRKERKDLFLVAFKTTAGASQDEQFEAGLKLMKESSANLVLANDLHTRINMIITPEQARYAVGTDRDEAILTLVNMALSRSEGTFTRSTVVEGDSIDWNSEEVPASLRAVVNHCIERGAYRPFMGKTVGHFAVKASDGVFYTSKRGVNFNELDKVGMVKVTTVGDHEVVAHGAKPSVGGQSQRIIFTEHPDVDCIVHFHCPLKPGVEIPVQEQWPHECGSHECGKNASDGLEEFEVGGYKHNVSKLVGRTYVKAVMLDRHGPNIVFNRDIDPKLVIEFIEQNFDLTKQTSDMASYTTEGVN